MSSARRAGLALLALLALSGCGFEPLHGGATGRSMDQTLERIDIAPIEDRSGQILRNGLIDRLQPHGAGRDVRYSLSVKTNETRGGLGIQRDATATFSQLQVFASFQLTDIASKAVIYNGTARSVSTFSLPDAGFGVVVALDDARNRALVQLSDDIAMRVTAFLRQRR